MNRIVLAIWLLLGILHAHAQDDLDGLRWGGFFITSYHATRSRAQHDELEPNLKEILHRNGIWGLEAIVM